MASVQDEEHEEEEDRSVLCLHQIGGRFGAAFFQSASGSLFVLADCPDDPDMTLTKALIAQTDPDSVLVTKNRSDRFIEAVKAACEVTPEVNDDDQQEITTSADLGEQQQQPGGRRPKLTFLASSSFNLDSCKRRILELDFPQEKLGLEGQSEEGAKRSHYLFINSLVDLADCNGSCIKATGALLKFWDTHTLDQNNFVVTIRPLALMDTLVLDETSLEALQIFHSPGDKMCVSKAGSWNKQSEGTSIYKLLNKGCKSVLGSKVLRHFCRNPPRKLAEIRERQKTVEFLTQPSKREFAAAFRSYVKGVKNVPAVIKKLVVGHSKSVKDWKSLRSSLINLVKICETSIFILEKDRGEELTFFAKLASTASRELYTAADLLDRVMDVEASVTRNKFTVKAGVDEELDVKRRTHDGLPDLLTKVVREEMVHLPAFVSHATMVYVPQIGYLLAVQPWRPIEEDEDGEEVFSSLEGLQFMFCADGIPHYKTEICSQLDETLGDTATLISEHENAIMLSMASYVAENAEAVLNPARFCSVLDCLLAMAEIAAEFDWVKPEIVEEGQELEIVDGKHPLQERYSEGQFVANSTRLGGQGHAKMIVLTGPNACGKSVYLKQVGLIVFLAHIGSFVPAQMAKIPLFDRIFTRILTVDSLSLGLSAFAVDLNQMALAFSSATERSLVLIDEFGKGTMQPDGEALLIASIEHFDRLERGCPFVLVSTHFHRIKALVKPEVNVDYYSFDFVHHEEEIVFLYKLISGFEKNSNAGATAKKVGISEEIVKRSRDITKALVDGTPKLRPRMELLEIEKALKVVERFMALDLSDPPEPYKFMEDLKNC